MDETKLMTADERADLLNAIGHAVDKFGFAVAGYSDETDKTSKLFTVILMKD